VLRKLTRTTKRVQFIEIEAQRCGLQKGKWRQNVQVEFYDGAFYEAGVTAICINDTLTARVELAN
jgi:hypothetical protein